MPLTLPPAQKAVPAPVIRSAPTSGFSPQVLIIVRNAGVKWSDSALRTSGRVSVMTATRSRTEQFAGAGVDRDFGGPVSPNSYCLRHCERSNAVRVGKAKRAHQSMATVGTAQAPLP